MYLQPQHPRFGFFLRRRAVALFKTDLAPKAIQRVNQRRWLAAVDYLGDRHLLASRGKTRQ